LLAHIVELFNQQLDQLVMDEERFHKALSKTPLVGGFNQRI